jgi:phospholipase/carboxylesterase
MTIQSILSGPSLLPLGGVTKKVVLFFHGYGADGNDLISLAEGWSLVLPDTEFMAPHAPYPCDESPFGRQWFSMVNWTMDKILQGLRDVAPIVNQLVAQILQDRQLSYQDLALVGFSQGAMLALYQAYYILPSCAGVIAYSGAFLEDGIIQPHNLPPTLLVHGDADQVVPVEASLMADELIRRIGGNPQTVVCKGLSHSIDYQGLTLGQQFLQNAFGSPTMNENHKTR